MARIQIPLDALTSRLNLGDRFAGMRSGSLSNRFSNLRPISEFLDIKRLSKPSGFAEVQSRVNYNLGHFSSNYAVVFVMLCIYALLSNPWLLFDIIFVVAGMWLIGRLDGRDLEIGSQRFSTSQLYTALYVIAIPVGLISSPFSTIMWLIGASGVVIIGHAALMDKPIDEAFSGEAWGRPPRRSRRRYTAQDEGDVHDVWGTERRVIEELDSDDTDTQGVGLVARAGNKRFTSDPLRFTGIDLGDRGEARSRRGNSHQVRGGYDDTTSESDGSEEDSGSDVPSKAQLALREKEDALVESALFRIRRAQAKGRRDVKLNQEELDALERRRQREEERKKRKAGQQRFAIPLSQLEPTSRKRGTAGSSDTERTKYPPMGYFPLPSASRSRPPSESLAPQKPSSRDTSPFRYSYVQRLEESASSRHVSDSAARIRPRGPLPHEEGWIPSSSAPSVPSVNRLPQSSHDPFRYMTAGPRAPYHGGAAPSGSHVSKSTSDLSTQTDGGSSGRRVASAAARGGQYQRTTSDETTSDEETTSEDGSGQSTSDDVGQGARVNRRSRSDVPDDIIVVEDAPDAEPEREPEHRRDRNRGREQSNHRSSKKSSAASSPSKRKPVGSGPSNRRRKGK